MSFKKKFQLLMLSFFVQPVLSADRGDFYQNFFLGWDFTRQVRVGGGALGYHPRDEIGLGISFDQSQEFSAPGIDLRWLIEPFEVSLHPQYAFWSENGGNWYMQLVLGTNYLGQITPNLAWLLAVRAYFPEHKTRSIFSGLGFRYVY